MQPPSRRRLHFLVSVMTKMRKGEPVSHQFLEKRFGAAAVAAILITTAAWCSPAQAGTANDLPAVLQSGVLRHLGVPYANFVTGSGDGMDVELIQRFAASLGVKYQYVPTSWKDVIPDLVGKQVKADGDNAVIAGEHPVNGDLIANGLTFLPWRQKVVDYSTPTFPTQIWLLARADSTLQPIRPSGDIQVDIQAVKAQMPGRQILGKINTCLDPSLYGIAETGASVTLFEGKLNELAPATINGKAEATLLDVPDALIALDKWPGKVKVIGPLSGMQNMGVGFSKSSPQLRQAFNTFLQQCKKDGIYLSLVKKYYPAVFRYYPAFFKSE